MKIKEYIRSNSVNRWNELDTKIKDKLQFMLGGKSYGDRQFILFGIFKLNDLLEEKRFFRRHKFGIRTKKIGYVDFLETYGYALYVDLSSDNYIEAQL